MFGPVEDSLLSQTLATLIPLCIGAAVLTLLYQLGLWIVSAVRRRWIIRRDEHRVLELM